MIGIWFVFLQARLGLPDTQRVMSEFWWNFQERWGCIPGRSDYTLGPIAPIIYM